MKTHIDEKSKAEECKAKITISENSFSIEGSEDFCREQALILGKCTGIFNKLQCKDLDSIKIIEEAQK